MTDEERAALAESWQVVLQCAGQATIRIEQAPVVGQHLDRVNLAIQGLLAPDEPTPHVNEGEWVGSNGQTSKMSEETASTP